MVNLFERIFDNKTKLQTLCDFHDLPVFGSSVSAYPIIILFERNEPDADHLSPPRK